MKRKWIVLLAAGCLTLTSCNLLPEEESFRTAPLISEYQREEFTQAVCTRGDLHLTRTISCVYVPVRTESLKFMVGGESYDEIFVEAGDTVQEGDLLAQLDVSGVEGRIESTRLSLERLLVQKEHLEQDRQLALERAGVEYETAEPAARAEALENVNERYDAQRQSLEDSLSIARMRMADYERQLAERQLRAPMAGTVTYVRKIKPGDVSSVGERVVAVADSTMSLFRAETEYWPCFEPGQHVVITSSRVEYEAVVMSEEQLGIEARPKEEGARAYVYFALTEPTFDLEDNDRGQLVLELDSREDVLRVPSSAVSTINGETVVYYQREDGMKTYKNVTVGLEAGNMIEIISGLEEGELVIAE